MSDNNFLDLDDLIDELDARKQFRTHNSEEVSYNSLLQSIHQIEKMAEKTDKISSLKKGGGEGKELTADLFANMSDSEMLSHFMPMRGIDFDQGVTEESFLQKKEKKKKEEIKQMFSADDFMPHKMLPQLNPLYHLSAFKSVLPNSVAQKEIDSTLTTNSDNSIQKEVENDLGMNAVVNFTTKKEQGNNKRARTVEEPPKKQQQQQLLQMQEEYDDEMYSDEEDMYEPPSKMNPGAPREIKKRKPRTYKYNPKPLQHKVCRSFVPDDLKDTEYWARRKRNNEAAKKSREERRKKELEILNSYEMMKQEYSEIKIENIRLKARNAGLEKQVTELKCKIR